MGVLHLPCWGQGGEAHSSSLLPTDPCALLLLCVLLLLLLLAALEAVGSWQLGHRQLLGVVMQLPQLLPTAGGWGLGGW